MHLIFIHFWWLNKMKTTPYIIITADPIIMFPLLTWLCPSTLSVKVSHIVNVKYNFTLTRKEKGETGQWKWICVDAFQLPLSESRVGLHTLKIVAYVTRLQLHDLNFLIPLQHVSARGKIKPFISNSGISAKGCDLGFQYTCVFLREQYNFCSFETKLFQLQVYDMKKQS